MSIAATSDIPMAQTSATYKPVGKKELDRNDFMRLFITQLQYQDPMKPMDSYEMASQLAQFSNMEATMKMSDNMEELLDYQKSQNNLQLLGLLGNDVLVSGNGVGVTDGKVGIAEFSLLEGAENPVIEIYDAADRLVRSIDLGYRAAGDYELTWDGKDLRGEQVEDGLYAYRIKALDEVGNEIEVDYKSSGRVTGIDFDSGEALLTLDNHVKIGVGDVVSVVQRDAPPAVNDIVDAVDAVVDEVL